MCPQESRGPVERSGGVSQRRLEERRGLLELEGDRLEAPDPLRTDERRTDCQQTAAAAAAESPDRPNRPLDSLPTQKL